MAMFTWRKITNIQGPEPRPRHGHRAIAIRDFIIVFGGGNEGMVEGIHVYNTSKNQWFVPATKGDIPPARAAFGLVAHDGRLLMFGGMLEYGQNCNNLYELQVSRWEWKHINARASKPYSMPVARFGHSFTLIGEKVYLFGGLWAEVVNKKSTPLYFNDLYILNIKDVDVPTWEVQEVYGPAPSPRESHTAVAYTQNEKSFLIIYGGMNGTRLGDIWFLNCETMSWTQPYITGSAPLPRSLHSSTVIGHKMFIFGGWVPLEPNDFTVTPYAREWKCTNTLAVLNLRTLTWETVTEFDDHGPRARAGHSAVAALQTRLYIWSGRDGYSKKWNNQICCKDFWFLETEVPPPPRVPHLTRSAIKSLEIHWDRSPTAEVYILQIQLYPIAIREPLIIDDKIPLSAFKQGNTVSRSTNPYTRKISPLSTVISAYPNATVQQLPESKMSSSKIEPGATEMKSAASPTAVVPVRIDNFGKSLCKAATTQVNQQYLESKVSHGQPSTNKFPLTRTSVITDIPQTLSSTAAIVRAPTPTPLISSFANTTAFKPVNVPESGTTSSVPATTFSTGNKPGTTYLISKEAFQVVPVVSTHQNGTVNSASSLMTTVKPVFVTPSTPASLRVSSKITSPKPPVMPTLGTNSVSHLSDASSMVQAAASTSTASRKIIKILQPRRQSLLQQNVEMPTEANAIKRQGAVTPVRTLVKVSSGTNILPAYQTGTVPNMVVSSAETKVSIQISTNTIMTPIRFLKTAAGRKYVVLQTKPTSNGVGEHGTNQPTVGASKYLKLSLSTSTVNTAARTRRAIVLKKINASTSSVKELDGTSVNPES